MNNQIHAIITGQGIINAVINGRPYSLHPESTFYKQAKEALNNKDFDSLKNAIDLDASLRKKTNNKVTVVNGLITYQGAPINNGLTNRIYTLMREDFPFEPLLKFLENVLQNPLKSAVDDLYTFLEKNSLPLTDDGCFLAWKYVTQDFKDSYSNTLDNSPGKTVSMPREQVNPNRNQTCSTGLHVCSYSYLPETTPGKGQRIVLVKVHPKNVCAVPTDYNNAKMRVCEYQVIQEVVDVQEQNEEFENNPVYSTDTEEYGVDDFGDSFYGKKPSGQRFWSVRNNKGQFVKKGE